jgi:hypothetical protein
MIKIEVRVTQDSVIGTLHIFFLDSIIQEVVATFNPHSLRAEAVRESTRRRTDMLAYTGDRLRGKVAVQNRHGTRDTFSVEFLSDASTVDRRILWIMARWLPLEPGRRYAFPMFDPDARVVYPLRITISDKTRISGPTGSHDAYRLALTTTPPSWFRRDSYLFPTLLWVSADSTRRLLRVERPGRRMVYDLTNH